MIYTTKALPKTDDVLIVDDAEPNRLLLEAILKHAGYKSALASNGLECLEYCARQLPKLILLDVMMPELDGFEVIKSLRKVYSKQELPIVLVTTRSEGSDVQAGFSAGANDYIVKPIDRQVLLARMEGCIQLADSHQSLMLVTEHMEQALSVQKLIGDALPEVIVVHDEDGRIVYANNSLHDALGESDLHRSIQSIDSIFEQIFDGSFHSMYAETFEPNIYKSDWSYLNEIQLKSPIFRVFGMFSKPIHFDEHFLRIWVWRDITTFKDLERKLSQQIRLDTVSLFASGVAHNFNNILGGILGASELLKRSKEERSLKCQAIIQRAVEAGMRLTDKMSALSKSSFHQSGEVKTIATMLEDLAQDISARADFDINFQFDLPSAMRLDISQRHASVLFGNVLLNAADSFRKAGTVRVSLMPNSSEQSSDLQGKAFETIVIEDDGSGMTDEELQRIFEPFYSTKNLDVANNLSVEGNGLGLWNVYNIVKMYEGDIVIESKKGKGTTVRLKLPVVPFAEEREDVRV